MTSINSKKSNIDYVREYIENHGSFTLKQETLEFLTAVQEEIEDLKESLESQEDKTKALEVERDEKDSRIAELEEQDNDFFTVDCGIGKIEWRASAIPLQTAMEEYTSKIASSYIPNSVNLF